MTKRHRGPQWHCRTIRTSRLDMRDPALNVYQPPTKGTQAHGTCKMLDGQFRISEPDFHPATATPRLGQIGIEHKGAIDQPCANAEVTNNKRQRPSATAEHVCVILAEFKRPLG